MSKLFSADFGRCDEFFGRCWHVLKIFRQLLAGVGKCFNRCYAQVCKTLPALPMSHTSHSKHSDEITKKNGKK